MFHNALISVLFPNVSIYTHKQAREEEEEEEEGLEMLFGHSSFKKKSILKQNPPLIGGAIE